MPCRASFLLQLYYFADTITFTEAKDAEAKKFLVEIDSTVQKIRDALAKCETESQSKCLDLLKDVQQTFNQNKKPRFVCSMHVGKAISKTLFSYLVSVVGNHWCALYYYTKKHKMFDILSKTINLAQHAFTNRNTYASAFLIFDDATTVYVAIPCYHYCR